MTDRENESAGQNENPDKPALADKSNPKNTGDLAQKVPDSPSPATGRGTDSPPSPFKAELTGIRKSKKAQRQDALKSVRVRPSVTKSGKPGVLRFLSLMLYKNLYLLGITLMRRGLRYRRRLRLVFSKLRGRLLAAAHSLGTLISRNWNRFTRHITEPFEQIAEYRREQEPVILHKKSRGEFALGAYMQIFWQTLKLMSSVLSTFFNYLAPIAASLGLLWVIRAYVTAPLGLQVVYKGQNLGIIRSEVVFEEATQDVRSRIVAEEDLSFINQAPALRLTRLGPGDEFTDNKEDLANKIIEASGGEIAEAYGFYVDDRFYGAVIESAPLLNAMDDIRDSNRVGLPDEEVQFMKSIRLKPGLYPEASLRPNDSLLELLRSEESTEQTYVVQTGDSPSLISQKLGVPYELLLQMNPDIEDRLQVGDELLTAVATPFLPVQNVYTNIYEEEFAYPVEEVQNATYARGYREIIQRGANGTQLVTERVTQLNGIPVDRKIIETEILRNPVTERVIVGISDPTKIVSGTDMTPSGAAAPSSGFIWPTTGGRATTYPNHSGNGIDIAIRAGEPIYASASGIIALVKYGYTGYGNYIIIDHQNGYQTLYAHNSAIYVQQGQYVNQGDVIAAMGRTGWATGNHVHFEVRYNGRYMWPPDFVGYSAWG